MNTDDSTIYHEVILKFEVPSTEYFKFWQDINEHIQPDSEIVSIEVYLGKKKKSD
jgi:hypothetical protein